MKRLLAVLMLVMPCAAEAATWSWTDAAGTVHFADNPSEVPKAFRHRLRQYGDGNGASTPATVPAEPANRETPPPPAAAPPAAPPGQGQAVRYGSRTAGEWQAAFRALRGELEEIDRQFERARREGGDGKTFLSREKIDELNARNKQLNEEYEALRGRFNRLVDEANAAGLPPEFAQ